MSIKSLFQNIAAAIKTKDTSISSLTPAEMPSAIINLPSGGDTPHYDMIDYMKVIPTIVYSTVNSSIIGNQFQLNQSKKLRGVYLYTRTNITATITLYNNDTNQTLKTTTANMTAGITSFIELEYALEASKNYSVFASSPSGNAFSYTQNSIAAILNDLYTFEGGRYGGIPGSLNGSWFFGIIPSVE